jgi:hypothetical protein
MASRACGARALQGFPVDHDKEGRVMCRAKAKYGSLCLNLVFDPMWTVYDNNTGKG